MRVSTNLCKNANSDVLQRDNLPFTPLIDPKLRLAITPVFMGLYAILFCIVYIQLVLILYYGHKRFSYQTTFLFTCLIWAALRTTLFSFFLNTTSLSLVDCFDVWEYWILYCLPVVLQFITLSLLVLYFSQAIIKCAWRYPPKSYIKYLWLILMSIVSVFIITNVVCAYMLKSHPRPLSTITVAQIRVIVNDSLFVVMSVFLSCCFYKLMNISSAVMPLESQGISSCQAKLACSLTILIYVTKACYNFVSVVHHCSTSLGWVIVSDQADLMYPIHSQEYVTFGIILFIWEFLPTFIVVLFFRVQRPPPSLTASGFSSHSYKHGFFFSNPNRYDSEDDLHKSSATGSSVNRSHSDSKNFKPTTYGSLAKTHHLSNSSNPSISQVP